MGVRSAENITFDIQMPLVIIGGGACGMAAALAAKDAGGEPVIVERSPIPQGNTALSSGMVPACGTKLQKAKGIVDSIEIMAADIQNKARGEADQKLVEAVCRESGPLIDWLVEKHQVELTLVEGFLYPGHSQLRMHAPPSRSGADLIGSMTKAVENAGIDILTNAHVTDLYSDADGRVRGLALERPDGTVERLGCDALILACNGYGGNAEMVQKYIPDMVDAKYFGHAGNQGDSIIWGKSLGGATRYLSAYQGHGSVAEPHGILISWAIMMEGGVQLNSLGKRFSNEHTGYSEQAREVIKQPGSIAWNVYDSRLHALGLDFEDYRMAIKHKAICELVTEKDLAALIGAPLDIVTETLAQTHRLAAGQGEDPFGRDFSTKPPLAPPYFAVKVTGSLFHTQGGLVVNSHGRVMRNDGTPLPNLFAGGGAACGVSGSADWGYLSGNGLLTALTLGKLAGTHAVLSLHHESAIPI